MRQHAQRAAASRFKRLQKKLKAACASIEELASLAHITAQEVEMILYRTHREHNIDMVAAGREQVGPYPIFVARLLVCPECGRQHRAEITLYSALPENEWRDAAPVEHGLGWVM
jgi:hypothetical protein